MFYSVYFHRINVWMKGLLKPLTFNGKTCIHLVVIIMGIGNGKNDFYLEQTVVWIQ